MNRCIVLQSKRVEEIIDTFCIENDEEYRAMEWLLARNCEHYVNNGIAVEDGFLFHQKPKTDSHHSIKIVFKYDEEKVYIIDFKYEKSPR